MLDCGLSHVGVSQRPRIAQLHPYGQMDSGTESRDQKLGEQWGKMCKSLLYFWDTGHMIYTYKIISWKHCSNSCSFTMYMLLEPWAPCPQVNDAVAGGLGNSIGQPWRWFPPMLAQGWPQSFSWGGYSVLKLIELHVHDCLAFGGFQKGWQSARPYIMESIVVNLLHVGAPKVGVLESILQNKSKFVWTYILWFIRAPGLHRSGLDADVVPASPNHQAPVWIPRSICGMCPRTCFVEPRLKSIWSENNPNTFSSIFPNVHPLFFRGDWW